MERSGMLSPTCSATVRLQRTKLRNEVELAHRTPQLNKHGVGNRVFYDNLNMKDSQKVSAFVFFVRVHK